MLRRVKSIINKPLNVRYYKSIESIYSQELDKLRSRIEKSIQKNVNLAVVVHLFYHDSWNLIEEKLNNIPEKFDLFITTPKDNKKLFDKITKTFPGTYIIKTPNLGRDILPFLKLMTVIKDFKNYQVVLKIHSKKSLHREDGKDWNKEILDELIPDNKKLISENIEKLISSEGSITGPAKQYLNLSVNFEVNGRDLTKILRNVYRDRKLIRKVLQINRSKYGFYAGTMFWLNIRDLKKIFDESNCLSKFFAPERGQIDGTYAHAMERAISLIPEIDQNTLFQMNETKIWKLDNYSGALPEWFR